MRVYISTSAFAKYDKRPLHLLKEAGVEYVLNSEGRKLTEDEIKGVLCGQGYDGLIAGTELLTKSVLIEASPLSVISRVGVGMDNIDMDAVKELDIKLYNTPDVLVDSVAELTVGLILSALRKIASMHNNMCDSVWKKEMGILFKGKTLGVVGYGKVGRRVAEIAKVFGAEVLFCDVRELECENCKQVCMAELFKNSDIISIHVSSKDNLISRDEILTMKDGVILVNTARGAVIDEDALCDGLSSGKIGCAALDVYSEEPYAGRLLTLDNVVLTPHVGSYAMESKIEMEIEAVENMIKGLRSR